MSSFTEGLKSLTSRGLTALGGAFALLLFSVVGQAEPNLDSSAPSPFAAGAKLYQEHCARCHGDDGQGHPEEYDEPLFGDRSIKSLAGLIERTMPEDEPESVRDDDARRVAEYIYHEFYSPEARQALLPPIRVELARLTVSQYRNAVADLVGSFHPSWRFEKKEVFEPGLHAEYFQSKGMSKADKLKIKRIDHTIDYDFKEGSPAEDITPDQFSGIWTGVLRAPDTGHYEFRVSTQNGARLYLNTENTGQRRKMRDDSSLAGQRAIIDGWVSSGEYRELSTRVFLLGGREYPIRLEFFKYKEKTASIRFEWKPPHSNWSLLDKRFVRTGNAPRTFVSTVPFPADDRSAGYERGTAVSPGWHEAITQGATEAATEIIGRLPRMANLKDKDPETDEKLKQFLTRFATRAFRRPLTPAEKELFGNTLFQLTANPEAAIRRGVILALTSPSFLYVPPAAADREPAPEQLAARLSLALWDSLPDGKLVEKVKNGELATEAAIREEIQRLVQNPRAKAKLREFFFHWLEIEYRDLSKDHDLYPGFGDQVVSDLRYSLERLIDDVVWSDGSDYRNLLLTDRLYLNERLRAYYAPTDEPAADLTNSDFQPVSLPDERAGILTHPFLLSAFAYHNTTSPIHRGVFLTRNVFGRALKPPPEAVAFKNDEFPADLSMREKITQLTQDAACMTCHSVINPLGFALENFDAVGRWRTTDNGQPVDPSSEYVTIEGNTQQFGSARDLAEYAVNSETAHRAFISHLFRFLVKQSPDAFGPNTLDKLQLHFAAENFSIQKLIAEIAFLSATHGRPDSPDQSDQ